MQNNYRWIFVGVESSSGQIVPVNDGNVATGGGLSEEENRKDTDCETCEADGETDKAKNMSGKNYLPGSLFSLASVAYLMLRSRVDGSESSGKNNCFDGNLCFINVIGG